MARPLRYFLAKRLDIRLEPPSTEFALGVTRRDRLAWYENNGRFRGHT